MMPETSLSFKLSQIRAVRYFRIFIINLWSGFCTRIIYLPESSRKIHLADFLKGLKSTRIGEMARKLLLHSHIGRSLFRFLSHPQNKACHLACTYRDNGHNRKTRALARFCYLLLSPPRARAKSRL